MAARLSPWAFHAFLVGRPSREKAPQCAEGGVGVYLRKLAVIADHHELGVGAIGVVGQRGVTRGFAQPTTKGKDRSQQVSAELPCHPMPLSCLSGGTNSDARFETPLRPEVRHAGKRVTHIQEIEHAGRDRPQ
jgi:hypothetical protein